MTSEAHTSQTVRSPRDLVVTLDGSFRDGPAATVAAGLAAKLDTSLHGLSVVSAEDPIEQRREVVAEAAQKRCATLTVEPADHIPNHLVNRIAGRVTVMGTRANPFAFDSYVGSVAEAVVAAATAPVVLVGPNVVADEAWQLNRIICPVSSDLASLVAVPAAAHWAREFGLPLSCLHVDTSGDVVAHGPDFWPPELFGEETNVVEGDGPAKDIAALAGDDALIVMATSSPQGLRRIAEGSVMADVVAKASRPVVVIGPNVHLSTLPF